MEHTDNKVDKFAELLINEYRLVCEINNVFPIKKVVYMLSKRKIKIDLLEFDYKMIDTFCCLLKRKIYPLHIEVINGFKNNVAHNQLKRLFTCLSECLSSSKSLHTLEICGMSASFALLKALSYGLCASRSLSCLAFYECVLSRKGWSIICSAIKNSFSLSHLVFFSCNLDNQATESVACLIKQQAINHSCMMWQSTLRTQQAYLDKMGGLRRISLINNQNIGDEGISLLAVALSDDLWLKALDLVNCGIGENGAAAVTELLKANKSLEFIDLSQNPFIPQGLLDEINKVLEERKRASLYEYSQFQHLTDPDSSNISCVELCPGIPWRIERRISARRKELAYFKSKAAREHKRRKKVEGKFKNLEKQIDNCHLVDNDTLSYIETCFQKFQSLLDHYEASRCNSEKIPTIPKQTSPVTQRIVPNFVAEKNEDYFDSSLIQKNSDKFNSLHNVDKNCKSESFLYEDISKVNNLQGKPKIIFSNEDKVMNIPTDALLFRPRIVETPIKTSVLKNDPSVMPVDSDGSLIRVGLYYNDASKEPIEIRPSDKSLTNSSVLPHARSSSMKGMKGQQEKLQNKSERLLRRQPPIGSEHSPVKVQAQSSSSSSESKLSSVSSASQEKSETDEEKLRNICFSM